MEKINISEWRDRPSEIKYKLWRGHEAFDFEETRAILIDEFDTEELAQSYIDTHPKADGIYWIEKIVVDYQ